MQSQSFQKTLDAAEFAAFLEALGAQLRPHDPASLPEGIQEASAQGLPVLLAIERSRSFAAARWSALGPLGPEHHETFFVHPAGSAARSGYRIVRPASDGPPRERPPAWWELSTARGQPCAGGPTPSFLELVGALGSQGRLRSANAELLARLEGCEDEAGYLRGLLDGQAALLKRYKARLRVAESAAAARRAPQPGADDDAEEPARLTRLEDLPAWAADRQDHIVVLPRALGGVKKSLYEKPEVVCAAFELLAGVYRQARLGLADNAEMNAALAQAGLRLEGSVAPSVAGENGGAYFVHWEGRRRFLDLHLLKAGAATSATACAFTSSGTRPPPEPWSARASRT